MGVAEQAGNHGSHRHFQPGVHSFVETEVLFTAECTTTQHTATGLYQPSTERAWAWVEKSLPPSLPLFHLVSFTNK